MFKRRKGYLLLTMLVLTGLAGRMHNNTLSTKERRQLINELKTSRVALMQSIEGLSEKQLSFRINRKHRSIRECLSLATLAQTSIWTDVRMSLHAAAIGKNNEDAQDAKSLYLQQCTSPLAKQSKTIETIRTFKKERDEVLRYARTTTEDVRSHSVQLGATQVDAFELMLLISRSTNDYARQIVEIKKSTGFPRQ